MLKRNHNYFDVIDTEYKAYILGFIYADGSIYQAKKGNRQLRMNIVVQEGDGNILEKLGEDIEGIKVRESYPLSISKNNWKKRAVLAFSSDLICNKLIEYGCFINKSKVGMRFPSKQVPEHLMHHFIRGFFDGDGSVTIHKTKYKGVNTNSTYFQRKIAFCSTDSKFLDDLISFLPINKIYKGGRLRTQYVHTYWVERPKDVEAMFEYLYKDAHYYLQRKYDKFLMSIKSQAVSTLTEGPETT